MNYNLKQLVNQATRVSRESSTLLHLFATNCPQNIVSVNTASLCLSDHEMVVAIRKFNSCKLPQRAVECRDYSRYNSTAFCDDLAVFNWNSVFETDDVNDAWLKWKDIFSNVCHKRASRRKKLVRGIRCPWLTREIKDLMNKRNYYFRKARKTNAEVD